MLPIVGGAAPSAGEAAHEPDAHAVVAVSHQQEGLLEERDEIGVAPGSGPRGGSPEPDGRAVHEHEFARHQHRTLGLERLMHAERLAATVLRGLHAIGDRAHALGADCTLPVRPGRRVRAHQVRAADRRIEFEHRPAGVFRMQLHARVGIVADQVRNAHAKRLGAPLTQLPFVFAQDGMVL